MKKRIIVILCVAFFVFTACNAKQRIGEVFSKPVYGEKFSEDEKFNEEFLTDENDEDGEGSGVMYGVRGLDYLALIDSNRVSNGYAFRPLVTISKHKGKAPEKVAENGNIESKNKTQLLESDFMVEETTVNKAAGEYILPNSNSAYLNQEDLKNLSARRLTYCKK